MIHNHVTYNANTHYRNTNLQFLGQEINFTFYTDTNWALREVFEQWFAITVDPTSKQSFWPTDTWGEISINAMDMQDNYRRSWVLHEVTPKVLNLQPMSMGSVGIVRTTLIVSATYWDSNYIRVDMGKDEILSKEELDPDGRCLTSSEGYWKGGCFIKSGKQLR